MNVNVKNKPKNANAYDRVPITLSIPQDILKNIMSEATRIQESKSVVIRAVLAKEFKSDNDH